MFWNYHNGTSLSVLERLERQFLVPTNILPNLGLLEIDFSFEWYKIFVGTEHGTERHSSIEFGTGIGTGPEFGTGQRDG